MTRLKVISRVAVGLAAGWRGWVRKSSLTLFALSALSALIWPLQTLALPIPINCAGMLVGTVTVNIVPPTATARGGVNGGFTTNAPMFPTLASAAMKCGEDHFNWFQVVVRDNMPPVDAGGNRLTPPYVDPPPAGYGDDPTTPGNDTQWADNLPWYWDEGADPPAGTPGFSDGFNLNDRIAGNTLEYSDFPNGPVGTSLFFKTFLASVNADGSLHSLYQDFVWDWNRPAGTLGSVSILQIPEPATLFLVVLGLWLYGVGKRLSVRS